MNRNAWNSSGNAVWSSGQRNQHWEWELATKGWNRRGTPPDWSAPCPSPTAGQLAKGGANPNTAYYAFDACIRIVGQPVWLSYPNDSLKEFAIWIKHSMKWLWRVREFLRQYNNMRTAKTSWGVCARARST